MNSRSDIEQLIYSTCLALDARDFAAFLELCDPGFHYAITAFSPEIRKEMVWLEHDKPGLQTLFANLPKHNSDHSPLSRHATVYTVDYQREESQARVVSAFQVFRTSLDGGVTELFAVGKLLDTVRLGDAAVRLLDRNVRLDTRMLGYGYHIPF